MKPVVSIEEMRALEAGAIQKGSSEGELMERAGTQIAAFIQSHFPQQKVTLIAGKGNNAGDGFVALTALKKLGFQTEAFELFHEGLSPLCQKNRAAFESAGGTFTKEFPKAKEGEGIILDGIFGIGFQGTVGAHEAKIIQCINNSHLPVISIDIPSGMNGNTGAAEHAVQASITLAIEYPKIGFFLRDGWNSIGKLYCLSLGLEAPSTTHFQWLEESDCNLPSLVRNRHKYQAGHVVGLSGSHGMCGAAMMASWAALKAGAGIVHLLHHESLTQELAGPPWEIVRTPFKDIECPRSWIQAAKCCFIGPGLGRSKEAEMMMYALWKDYKDKAILDADCLNWLASQKKPFGPLPNSILTPHIGEMKRLLDLHTPEPLSVEFLNKISDFARKNDTHIILKGAPTFLFSPAQPITIMSRGDPGMATAGSGDVLTGILAALRAGGLSCKQAMISGTLLHAIAGEIAAVHESSYSMTATSIINALPEAFCRLGTHAHDV